MRIVLFTLMSLAPVVVAAATVYRWVDDGGVTHYSDQPHENAEKVELKPTQTYSAPKNIPVRPSPRAPAKELPAYRACNVSEPANDQSFANTSTVTAGVSVTPPVRPGDQLIVTLDGQRVPGVPIDGGQFTISPIERGTHSLSAMIQDVNGHTVCKSADVTFHVHQPSLLNPVNPLHPARH